MEGERGKEREGGWESKWSVVIYFASPSTAQAAELGILDPETLHTWKTNR